MAGAGVRPRVRAWMLGVSVLVVVLALGGSRSASAGLVHPFVSSFAAGSIPQAVAVDQTSGDLYVIDLGANTVLKFDASGAPTDFSAVGSNTLDGASGPNLTPEGGFFFDFNAAQVAVDNSGGATDGYLYVTNSFAGVVDVFDTTGTYVGHIDGSLATPQTGGEACGVAIDPTGHVYVAYYQGHVDKYTPVDADPANDTFAGQLENVFNSCNLAVDSAGTMYVSSWSSGPLTKYDPSQLDQPSPAGTVITTTSFGVAANPLNDDVYVDEGDHVAQYDPAGVLIGQSGIGHLSSTSFGVAINATTDNLYASDSSDATVKQFGPAVDVPEPTVTITPPSDITTSGATFAGTVNPGGADPLSDTTWHFEYSTDGGASWTSTPGGDAGTGTSPVPVSEQVDGLLPNQDVQVRLVATNAGATVTSSVESFTTIAIAPDAVTRQAQDIGPSHAVLTATLNAHHAPTTYYFEYGTTTAYGTSVPAGQDGNGGAEVRTIAVTQAVYGLQPGTTYHYRVVAHNLANTAVGTDRTFTTTTALAASSSRAGIPGSGFLPDERGWEQASPPEKEGADVMGSSMRTHAASTETPTLPMAVTFASLGGFDDVQGTNVGTDYMAIRTAQAGTNGWATHGITSPQRSLTFADVLQALDPQWESELSPDLTHGVYRSRSGLTDAPNVSEVENLYVRSDLRTPGTGTLQLVSDCPGCSSPLPPSRFTSQIPRLAGTSADFSHVIFESTYALAPGATAGPGHPNLYESVNGAVRVAGILPDGTVAPVSIAGRGTGAGTGVLRYTPHTISEDGSRVFFTDTSTGDVVTRTGTLYMRVDGTTTVQLNASEKTPPPDPPDPEQPASYADASANGSRVFFTTRQQLTNEPGGPGAKLYMYDVNAPVGHHLTLISVDHEPADPPGAVHGVMGTNADGHYVYFVAGGQLVAGQPTDLNRTIYEWHDGDLFYVGQLADPSDEGSDLYPSNWNLGALSARITPDGRHVLFVSSSGFGLLGYQQNGHAELYLYSADSHELQCVSCDPSGAPPSTDAGVAARTGEGATDTTSHLSHPLADDGSRVLFHTGEELVREDVNNKQDAYEFDVATGTPHLLSSGKDQSDSFFMEASADGADVFFLTREQLVGWDFDQNYDLYDARVNGGLPEPSPVPPCSGEGCHGSSPGEPAAAEPVTHTVHGKGNLKPATHVKPKPRRCRRGFVRKRVRGKVRCVKKRRHAKHTTRSRRSANSDLAKGR
jgi:hypothetical protein